MQGLGEVIKSPNIYEFDLQQFFPMISVNYVTAMLHRLGLPKGLVRRVEVINKSLIKFEEGKKLDESNEE